MKKEHSIPAILLLAVVLVFSAGAMARSVTREVVQVPIVRATATIALERAEQEIQVTATHIAVMGQEAISNTQTMHEISREKQRQSARRQALIADVASYALVAIIGAGALAIVLSELATGTRAIRQLAMPVRRKPLALKRGVYLLDSDLLTDTETGKTWDTALPAPADRDHALLLAQQRALLPAELMRRLTDIAILYKQAGNERAVDRWVLRQGETQQNESQSALNVNRF